MNTIQRLNIWLQSNNAKLCCPIIHHKNKSYFMVVVPVFDKRKGLHYIFGTLQDIEPIGLEFSPCGISYYTKIEDAVKAANKYVKRFL